MIGGEEYIRKGITVETSIWNTLVSNLERRDKRWRSMMMAWLTAKGWIFHTRYRLQKQIASWDGQ